MTPNVQADVDAVIQKADIAALRALALAAALRLPKRENVVQLVAK